MYQLRPANKRGRTKTGWLDSYHSFSFGDYCDPAFMGFSDLRVINDDIVAPGMGFGMHPHADMEIISIILSGELKHQDSLGNGGVIRRGEIQKMTAGSGIMHSEYNPSPTQTVRFLQIWILPNIQNLRQSYEQKKFDKAAMTNRLCCIASPDGRDDSFLLHQDAELFQCLPEAKAEVICKLDENRKYWIQVAEGSIEANGNIMVAGDGMAISGETDTLEIRGTDNLSNFLLFNLRP